MAEKLISKNDTEKVNKILLKAIKSHCYECSGCDSKEVKLCNIDRCPLYMYRTGKIITETE